MAESVRKSRSAATIHKATPKAALVLQEPKAQVAKGLAIVRPPSALPAALEDLKSSAAGAAVVKPSAGKAKSASVASKPVSSKAQPAATKSAAIASAQTKATAKPRKGTAARKPAARITHEQIARLAYLLWLERGGGHGLHEQDWARAEQQLVKAG